MTRADITEKVIAAKLAKKLTWKALAEACGRSEIWTTSALLGQQAMGAEEAAAVGQALDLSALEVAWLQIPPSKGSLDATVSTDPLIYRFHEVVQVYGTTLKALIHEEFGDGIISAINFKLKVDKVEDPDGGHRAVITLDGKYLPTKPY